MKHWILKFVPVLLLSSLVLSQQAWAAPATSVLSTPRMALSSTKSTISYQGYLVGADGSPVNAAALAMIFRFYNVASAGTVNC